MNGNLGNFDNKGSTCGNIMKNYGASNANIDTAGPLGNMNIENTANDACASGRQLIC